MADVTLEAQERQVLYDDADLRVIWHGGRTDYLLITFGDMTTLASGDRFFADAPCVKAGITCLGIMPKRENWYPVESVARAVLACASRLAAYSDRVVYGGSMGGYAALKYSRLLGATTILALCPQWSIDPAECEGVDPGWGQHFHAGLSRMGIRLEDVAGEAFVVFDPAEPRDRFHARRIAATAHTVHLLSMPMVGHHVTRVLAGTERLLRLIAAGQKRDLSAFANIIRESRKRSSQRLRRLALRASRNHSKLLALALVARADDDAEARQLGTGFFFSILPALLGRADRGDALRFGRRFHRHLKDPMDRILAASILADAEGREIAIVSGHDTALVFDPDLRRCVHRTVERDGSPSFHIRVRMTGRLARFHVQIGGVQFDLVPNDRAQLVLQSQDGQDSTFQIGDGQDGGITFSRHGLFLTAEPNGSIACHRPKARSHESFRLEGIHRPGA